MNEWKLAGRALGVGSTLVVLPFLFLCLYWHPVGTHGVDWISNWGGKYDAMGWWAQQADWYQTTMGRYSSTALLSTVSYWYSLHTARIVVLGIHLGLVACLYYFFRCLYGNGKRSNSAVCALAVMALYLNQLSNPYDSLYRLSGLFIYQAGLIATLLLAAFLLRQRLVAATVTVVIAVGTNEITLLHCGLLLGAYVLLHPERLSQPKVLLMLAVAAVAATVALLAPGNWVRADQYDAGGRTLPELVSLVVATGGFTWLSWLSSTALIPLILIGMTALPRLEISRRQRWTSIVTLLVLPVLSFAPVLLATRGDSLPEGIADWQIIPVALLLAVLLSGSERLALSQLQFGLLVGFVVSFNLLSGLRIDRSRTDVPKSSFERIVVNSPPGNAWMQLFRGESKVYDHSVMRQYDQIRLCEAADCPVTPLRAVEGNYLYDSSYDRRIRPGGDPWFGYLANRPASVFVSQ